MHLKYAKNSHNSAVTNPMRKRAEVHEDMQVFRENRPACAVLPLAVHSEKIFGMFRSLPCKGLKTSRPRTGTRLLRMVLSQTFRRLSRMKSYSPHCCVWTVVRIGSYHHTLALSSLRTL